MTATTTSGFRQFREQVRRLLAAQAIEARPSDAELIRFWWQGREAQEIAATFAAFFPVPVRVKGGAA